jgi:hypothetical protein
MQPSQQIGGNDAEDASRCRWLALGMMTFPELVGAEGLNSTYVSAADHLS